MDMDRLKTIWINKRDIDTKNYTHRLKRKRSLKEHSAVAKLLSAIAREYGRSLELLDIPVGTGRFFSIYKELDIQTLGYDISPGMLRRAVKEAELLQYHVEFKEADIINIPLPNEAVDVVVCMKFFVHLEPDSLRLALVELTRVARSDIIFGIRIYDWESGPVRLLRAMQRDLKQAIKWLKNNGAKSSNSVRQKPGKHKFVKAEVMPLLTELGLAVESQETTTIEKRGTNLVFHVRKPHHSNG